MPEAQPAIALETVVHRIFELRGQRVMLDEDLAVLYGVENRALIQAVKRNLDRFPVDFIFQVSSEEWKNLKSQNVISSFGKQSATSQHGGRRSAPYAFTEHGAIMLSGVLNSQKAKEISVLIVRAFVWMRQTVPAYTELAAKVAELEEAVGKHDAALGGIIEALHELILPPDKAKRRIGY